MEEGWCELFLSSQMRVSLMDDTHMFYDKPRRRESREGGREGRAEEGRGGEGKEGERRGGEGRGGQGKGGKERRGPGNEGPRSSCQGAKQGLVLPSVSKNKNRK